MNWPRIGLLLIMLSSLISYFTLRWIISVLFPL